MSIESYIPRSILEKFEFYDYGHALDILTSTYPDEWNDLLDCLDSFRLTKSDIKMAGGNKSLIPKRFDEIMFPKGWKEVKITADLLIKKGERSSRSGKRDFRADRVEEITVKGYIDGHNVDFVKNKVAFDLEWNSKDQTFDRDLLAMRSYFDARIIDVGIIITRSEELNDVFASLGKEIKDKYGASTTWMGKLQPRLQARRNGGCPILAIGIRKNCIVDE
ncbi:MAG: restriction endonuclease [Oscillospiraceae bacterium]|nr:restriction endonuclease [Oscillospiraceae bacterium]